MKSLLKSGDILLFRRSGWVSRLIQWGTNSPYSHIAVMVDPDKHLIIEAYAGLVRAADIRKMTDYDIYRVWETYPFDKDKLVSFLVDKLNSKYDYLGVAFLGVLKLLRLKSVSNAWQKSKDYFCSELVSAAYKQGGLDIAPKLEDDVTSPADIANSVRVRKVYD